MARTGEVAAESWMEQPVDVGAVLSLLVHSDTLDREERRACLRGDAVISAEGGVGFPPSRIVCGTEDLKPTNQQGEGRWQ
jgi:hypothetical protein